MQEYTLSNFPARGVGGPPGGAGGTFAREPIPVLGPRAGQKLTTIDFLAPRVPLKKRPIFGPLQNRPRGWQSRPLAALGPPRAPFFIVLGSILGAIFDHFLILFLNPQKQDFAIPYYTF